MGGNAENTVYLVMGIALAALISFVLMLFQRKKTQEAWEATVTNIRQTSETDSNEMSTDYILISYTRTDGKSDAIKVQTMVYSMWFPPDLKPGDRLVKISGEPMPKRAA